MTYWLLKAILKPSLRAFYGIKVEGLENVPRKGPAIIAANHLSFLDSLFIPLVIKWRKLTYLAKSDYFKSWKTAWFFKAAGQIPVDRDDKEKSRDALGAGLSILKAGKLLGIYPEGTRSPDGKLHRGRTGAARLALAAQVPIVPCGVVGSNDVMPKAAKWPRLRPGMKVKVRFGKPIDVARFEGKEKDRSALRALTDEVMAEILKLSGQEYVDEYATRSPGRPRDARRRPDDGGEAPDEILAG